MATLTPDEEKVRIALVTLKQVSGLSDTEIARRADHADYQSVQQRRAGQTRISVSDMHAFARAFEVPVEMFLWSRAEILRWVAENEAFLPAEIPVRAWEYLLSAAS